MHVIYPVPSPPQQPTKPRKLLDQISDAIRLRHYSFKTEKAYVFWAKHYIFFHKKRHPMDMGAPEIESFLNFLATQKNVSAKTQNQALNALAFLYKAVLKKDFGQLKNLIRAKTTGSFLNLVEI